MEETERQQLKDALLKQIDELKRRLPGMEKDAKPIPPDSAVGRLSRMDAIREKGVRDAALLAAKERLERLEKRLETIDEPDYSLCTSCRQPIPVARMLYLPDTDRCVRCAGSGARRREADTGRSGSSTYRSWWPIPRHRFPCTTPGSRFRPQRMRSGKVSC